MAVVSESLIRQLNELEVRCIIGNFENYNLPTLLEGLKAQSTSDLFSILIDIVSHIVEHKYHDILQIPLSGIGLRFDPKDTSLFLEEEDSSEGNLTSYVKQLILLFVAVSALQEFIRINVCGPHTIPNDILPIAFSNELEFFDKEDILLFLSKDREFPRDNIHEPSLLCLSLLCLEVKVANEVRCLTHNWWHMRCLMVQQEILPEKIASLHDKIAELSCATLSMEWINEDRNVQALLLLFMESAKMHLFYHEVNRAKHFITSARNLVGLCIELSGAYGKRTQFQQKPVAQLFVKLTRDLEKLTESFANTDASKFPPDLHLQDDTLLDNIAFIDADENRVEHLLPDEQLVLLGECWLKQKSSSSDELLQEETIAYVNCLLAQPKVWSIYVTALILRSKLEKNSSRRIDRALRQLETIISCIKEKVPPFHVRIPMLYAVPFPMLWLLQKELADLLMSVGATKSALEIYKLLNLWEEIVHCYQQLDRTACAKEVITTQLMKEKTPLLYCLLGDVTDDPVCYLKADTLAKGRSARSHRSLGYFYYKRKDYKSAATYFLQSVQINHLQPGVWFSLGYAAQQCEDFELAARAYRHVVSLDDDNFEAWNNLAAVYVKTKQKERAWRSFNEALKCNYEDSHVWENFMQASLDVLAFEDVLRSYHRLLDIREKFVDINALGLLVTAVIQNVPDIGGQLSSRLKPAVLALFGRLTSLVRRDGSVWRLYSILLWPDENAEGDVETLEKAITYHQQAIVSTTGSGSWTRNHSTFLSVLKMCLRHTHLVEKCIHSMDNEKARTEKKNLFKIMMKGIMSKAGSDVNIYDSPEQDELVNMIRSIKEIHDRILAS